MKKIFRYLLLVILLLIPLAIFLYSQNEPVPKALGQYWIYGEMLPTTEALASGVAVGGPVGREVVLYKTSIVDRTTSEVIKAAAGTNGLFKINFLSVPDAKSIAKGDIFTIGSWKDADGFGVPAQTITVSGKGSELVNLQIQRGGLEPSGIGPGISNLQIKRKSDNSGDPVIVSFTTTSNIDDVLVYEKTGIYEETIANWTKKSTKTQTITIKRPYPSATEPEKLYLYEYEDANQVGAGDIEKYYMVVTKEAFDEASIVGKLNIELKPLALAISVPFETPLAATTNIDTVIGNQLNTGDKIYSWTKDGTPVQGFLGTNGMWNGPDAVKTIQPGVGFWLVRMAGSKERTVTFVGQLPTTPSVDIKIGKSYAYMIGIPYPKAYPLAQQTNLNNALANAAIDPASKIYSWTDKSVPIQSSLSKANKTWSGNVQTLERGFGYWIGNLTGNEFTWKLNK